VTISGANIPGIDDLRAQLAAAGDNLRKLKNLRRGDRGGPSA
jgi:hypothetical protein